MIRFNCPNCARPYEVPDALAKLPLVCKQCGQRITPPERSEAPPLPLPAPPPPPVVVPRPPAPKPSVPVAKPPAPKPAAVPPAKPVPSLDDQPSDDDVLISKPDSTPDIDFNVGGPTAASLSDAARARPAGLSDANRPRPVDPNAPPEPPASTPDINLDLLPKAAPPAPPKARRNPVAEAPPQPRREATLLPVLADFAVFVLLVAVGVLIGQLLVGKPTMQVIADAGSAAKFPPKELIVWAGPPLMFGLVYVLLGSREKSVGAWLRRKANPARKGGG